jgi:large subunit ribosomal protein L9
MKLILNESVDGLGEIGDLVEVKSGYARNFLFPKKLAREATRGNLKILEQEKEIIEKKKTEQREKLMSLAEKIKGKEITILKKVGEEGKLFGTVTHVDIADALKKDFDIEISKKMVVLPEHIKFIGIYDVPINVGHGTQEVVKVTVDREE